jgi:hypothetical protein
MSWAPFLLPVVDTSRGSLLHSDVLIENRINPEIVRIGSVFVIQSHIDAYLKWLREEIIPGYQAAQGFSAIVVLRRSLVGYEEITTVTMWQSAEEMQRFATQSLCPGFGGVLLQREPPHVYELVFYADPNTERES